ncbi:MAG TPA: hypothetical protein VFX21_04330 [Acidimicrobiia bacterium]|nr:hypothetical protein [Acidimicrobiia bacterium]
MSASKLAEEVRTIEYVLRQGKCITYACGSQAQAAEIVAALLTRWPSAPIYSITFKVLDEGG